MASTNKMLRLGSHFVLLLAAILSFAGHWAVAGYAGDMQTLHTTTSDPLGQLADAMSATVTSSAVGIVITLPPWATPTDTDTANDSTSTSTSSSTHSTRTSKSTSKDSSSSTASTSTSNETVDGTTVTDSKSSSMTGSTSQSTPASTTDDGTGGPVITDSSMTTETPTSQPSDSIPTLTSTITLAPDGNSTTGAGSGTAPTVPIAVSVSVGVLIVMCTAILIFFYVRKKRRDAPARAESPPPYNTDFGASHAVLGSDRAQDVGTGTSFKGPGELAANAAIELVNRPSLRTLPATTYRSYSAPATNYVPYSPTAAMSMPPHPSTSVRPYHSLSSHNHPHILTPGGHAGMAYGPGPAQAHVPGPAPSHSPDHHGFRTGPVDPLRSSPPMQQFSPSGPSQHRTRLDAVNEVHELA